MGNFSFGEERIGPTYCMNCIRMCMNELNFENKSKKLEVNPNPKTVTRNATQLQPVVTSLFDVEILSFTQHYKGYKIL
jgi:hypothetical protein